MEIVDAEYKKGKLGFRLTIQNNSSDTLHLINAGALRFIRNTRVFTAEEMGLKELPYSVSSPDFGSCPEKIEINAASAWKSKERRSIDEDLFISIAPGEDRRLEYSEFKVDDFCAKPGAKTLKIKVTYKAIVNQNYFTPQQLKELQAIISECESVESELPVSDLYEVKKMLRFYQGYQQRLNKLSKQTIISKEAVVDVK